jgi:hypothetical protein
MAGSGLAPKLSCSCQDHAVSDPTAKPLMRNALSPKLSCSCQEAAAGAASGRAAADLDGCFPAPPGSAVGASDSRDVHPATASRFPVRPGDTRDQSLVQSLAVIVAAPPTLTLRSAAHLLLGTIDRRLKRTLAIPTTAGLDQADSSGFMGNESLRRIETSSGTQICGEKSI